MVEKKATITNTVKKKKKNEAQREIERERERERLGQINSLPYECMCEWLWRTQRVRKSFWFYMLSFEPAQCLIRLSFLWTSDAFLGPTHTLPKPFYASPFDFTDTLLSSAWACSIYGCYGVNSAGQLCLALFLHFKLFYFILLLLSLFNLLVTKMWVWYLPFL